MVTPPHVVKAKAKAALGHSLLAEDRAALAEVAEPWESGPPPGQFDDEPESSEGHRGVQANDADFVPPTPKPIDAETAARRKAFEDAALAKKARGEPLDDNEQIAIGEYSGDPCDGTAAVKPSFEEPFAGLPFFQAHALRGREAIEAEAAKPIGYFWQPIASSGQVIFIGGPPGGGKTSLAGILIAARANTGDPIDVLGYRVTPAPPDKYLVFIEAEHGRTSAARKLVKSCRLLGVDLSALDRVIVLARTALQVGTDAWRELERLNAAGLVSDIIIDTLAQVAPGDANDEQAQAEIFRALRAAIEQAPADAHPVVWALTHTRKSGAEALEDIAGSVQRTGGADAVLLVNPERIDGRVASAKVTFIKLREDPDPEPWPMPVTFTIEGGRIKLDNPTKRDERPMEQRVLSALEAGPKTKSELKRALRTSDTKIEEAITNLFAAHQLATGPDKDVNGRTYKTFTIRVTN